MAARAKRHLVVSRAPVKSACGLTEPRFWTTHPAEVTCGACIRTLRMADAELAERQRHQ